MDAIKYKFFVAIFLTSIVFNVSASVAINDLTGDAYGRSEFSDITRLEITDQGPQLRFRLDFADLSQGIHGAILLDLDGNRQTGGLTNSDITEANIEFTVAILGICNAQLFSSNGTQFLNCGVQGNSLFIDLPALALNPDRQKLEIAAVTSSDFLCEGRDRLPDEGYFQYGSGLVHIDNKGIVLPTKDYLDDPADSQKPVDLKGLSMEVSGEHLNLRVQYHHSIGSHDIDSASLGMISLDVDRDILTGFQNTSEIYPTFGIDAYIRYFFYPWSLGGNLEANIGIQDPHNPAEVANLQVGKYSTDSCYRRVENGVEFSIPLAKLPALSNQSVVIAQTMEPIAGLFDTFPNDSGLGFFDGQRYSYNSCKSPGFAVSDPAGDSYAFGGDNDDLIELRGCYYDQGMLIRVKYTGLDLIGEALTSMSLDIDQDILSGESTYNVSGDLVLGSEYTLVSALSSSPGGRGVTRGSGTGSMSYFGGSSGSSAFFTAIMVQGSSGDLIRSTYPLYTLNFGTHESYMTVPFRLIDNRQSVNVYAKTMSGAFGAVSFADEIPDLGVLSIQKDQDADGVTDQSDNCTLVSNANQADTDQDGYGNACDADLNNDKIANALDLGIFKKCYLKQAPDGQCPHPEHADFNNDGKVNSLDLGLFKKMYLKPPGPSELVNSSN